MESVVQLKSTKFSRFGRRRARSAYGMILKSFLFYFDENLLHMKQIHIDKKKKKRDQARSLAWEPGRTSLSLRRPYSQNPGRNRLPLVFADARRLRPAPALFVSAAREPQIRSKSLASSSAQGRKKKAHLKCRPPLYLHR
ncbi:hypothetical protein IEQ34_022996 [Dendrobium chrysotoxum]|uniref:Uncharacterized protein n=1 Tax=Dendrobium chrysotoxum TaxID=161865 RepID=A0AAV7FZE3_DENCH|nr:hypothetical protein IEQ34_022996 [Dendrobium chrysotoxum]